MTALLQDINWREPLWLLIALQPLLFYVLSQLIKKLRQEKYAEPHLLPWARLEHNNKKFKHHAKKTMLAISWIAFAIAMAGPRIANKVISTDTSNYTNIIVLFDVSRSMLARDIQPSRLERAKLELYDLINRSQQSRIGIVLYAAKAHLLSPLTSDKSVLQHYISSIKSPLLPTRGSDLLNGLQYSAKLLEDEPGKARAILIISDGESTQHNITNFAETLSYLGEKNTSVYSLVSGTEDGAPLLATESGWLKFNNKNVVSKAQVKLLKTIALSSNGRFSHIDDGDKDWRELYDKGIAKLNPGQTQNVADAGLVIWYELYPWFLMIAVLFFVLAYSNLAPITANLYLALILIASFALLLFPSQSYASEAYEKAFHAYQQHNYQVAEELFSRITGYSARIGEASAAYQNKNYKKASHLFIQAILDAKTDQQRSQALFNLANCYYQLEQYQQATATYQDVLRYRPDFKPAQINLAHAKQLAAKQQKEQLPITTRGGKGPRTARLAADAEIGKGSLTLGDPDDEVPPELPLPTDDTFISNNKLNLSITGLVTQDVDSAEDAQWTYQVTNVESLGSLINRIESNETVFWQRLFEWEEGYPAPLDEPRSMPGVKPW